jgi:DNA-binding PadR family transcriptional regulator
VAVFLEDPSQHRYGFELTRQSGVKSGTLYPILDRLEGDLGWLDSYWEDVDPSDVGRPRKRFYRLTATGEIDARRATIEALERLVPKSWRPGWNLA